MYAVTETHIEVAVDCPDWLSYNAMRMHSSVANTQPGMQTSLDKEAIATLFLRNQLLITPGIDEGTMLTMHFSNNMMKLAVEGPQQHQFVDPTHLVPAMLSC
jgi:hypothetical protein